MFYQGVKLNKLLKLINFFYLFLKEISKIFLLPSFRGFCFFKFLFLFSEDSFK